MRVLIFFLFISSQLNAQQKELFEYSSNSEIEILYVGDYKKGELDIEMMKKQWWGLY